MGMVPMASASRPGVFEIDVKMNSRVQAEDGPDYDGHFLVTCCFGGEMKR